MKIFKSWEKRDIFFIMYKLIFSIRFFTEIISRFIVLKNFFDLSQIFISQQWCSLTSSTWLFYPSLAGFLFLRVESRPRVIECVACFFANNCRQVRLAEPHRWGDGQDLDVRAGWRILDFEWVSLSSHEPTIVRPASCKKGWRTDRPSVRDAARARKCT